MPHKFEYNDHIIWDSHFGYEIGYFKGEGVMMNTYKVDLITGVCPGIVSISRSEIKPYTDELVKELSLRYRYTKEFSKTF